VIDMHTHKLYASQGFTLIELMIVVAITAILAAIAYPSYRDFVRRSDRADAKSILLENAQFLERNFTLSNAYNKDSAGNDISLPVAQAPRDGTPRYDIEGDFSATEFVLRAVPTGAQADDDCGTLTLNHQGKKDVEDATIDKAQCWNR
jgi:type IV pilus assembly protein PilE